VSDRFPTLQEAINTAVEMGLRNLHTMIPAKVVKWDADKQQANCQILIKQVTEDEEGEREVTSWPVVTGVPVQFMGAGEFRITVPVDKGTIGMLLFSHRSLDRWLSGSGSEVDPELDHDHALTDAVFLPGLRTFGAPLSPSPPSDVIELSAGGATNFVALANKVNDQLQAVMDAVTAGKDAVVAQDGGMAAFTAMETSLQAAQFPEDVSATKVKAE
jgi:hypothetical protein